MNTIYHFPIVPCGRSWFGNLSIESSGSFPCPLSGTGQQCSSPETAQIPVRALSPLHSPSSATLHITLHIHPRETDRRGSVSYSFSYFILITCTYHSLACTYPFNSLYIFTRTQTFSHTSIKKMPSPLKRKSNPEVPHAPSKRLRTDGLFTPRVKTPTGASRSIPRASRYQPSSTSPAKRTLDEEQVEQGLSSKVRILDNRECLHLLPSRKPLPVPAPELQRKIRPRSPLKNAIIARLSRRRAILSQKQKLERLTERMDSDNVYYFSEGLSDGIKLFTSRSPASFSSKYWTHGLSLEFLL